MEYISTKEASAKWGISTTRITILANEGRIPETLYINSSDTSMLNYNPLQMLLSFLNESNTYAHRT